MNWWIWIQQYSERHAHSVFVMPPGETAGLLTGAPVRTPTPIEPRRPSPGSGGTAAGEAIEQKREEERDKKKKPSSGVTPTPTPPQKPKPEPVVEAPLSVRTPTVAPDKAPTPVRGAPVSVRPVNGVSDGIPIPSVTPIPKDTRPERIKFEKAEVAYGFLVDTVPPAELARRQAFIREFSSLVAESGDILIPIPSSALPREEGVTARVPTTSEFVETTIAQERAGTAVGRTVLGFTPLSPVVTASEWNRLSNAERAGYLALDALWFLPALTGARAAAAARGLRTANPVMRAERAVSASIPKALGTLDPTLAADAKKVIKAQQTYAKDLARADIIRRDLTSLSPSDAAVPQLQAELRRADLMARSSQAMLTDAAGDYAATLQVGKSPLTRFVDTPALRSDLDRLPEQLVTDTRASVFAELDFDPRTARAEKIVSGNVENVNRLSKQLENLAGETRPAVQDNLAKSSRRLVDSLDALDSTLQTARAERIDGAIDRVTRQIRVAQESGASIEEMTPLARELQTLRRQRARVDGGELRAVSDAQRTLNEAVKHFPADRSKWTPDMRAVERDLAALEVRKDAALERLVTLAEPKRSSRGGIATAVEAPPSIGTGGGVGTISRVGRAGAGTLVLAAGTLRALPGGGTEQIPGGGTGQPSDFPVPRVDEPGTGGDTGGPSGEPGGKPQVIVTDLPPGPEPDKPTKPGPTTPPKEDPEVEPPGGPVSEPEDEPEPVPVVGTGVAPEAATEPKDEPQTERRTRTRVPTEAAVRTPSKPGKRFVIRLPGRKDIELGAGQYPRVVQWQQGVNVISQDLLNGRQSFEYTPSTAGQTPIETFRVSKISTTPPRKQRFDLGIVDISVTPDGLTFSQRRGVVSQGRAAHARAGMSSRNAPRGTQTRSKKRRSVRQYTDGQNVFLSRDGVSRRKVKAAGMRAVR